MLRGSWCLKPLRSRNASGDGYLARMAGRCRSAKSTLEWVDAIATCCGTTGTEMGIGGVYREVVKPERVSATEKFDEAWYPGEAVVTMMLAEQGSQTVLTQTVLYESEEARAAALKTRMKSGVARSYDRLEEMLESTAA